MTTIKVSVSLSGKIDFEGKRRADSDLVYSFSGETAAEAWEWLFDKMQDEADAGTMSQETADKICVHFYEKYGLTI